MRKALIAFGLIAALLSGLPFGCGSKNTSSQPTVQTATVKKGNLTVEITATGNLAMPDSVNLSFGSSGKVQEVLVEMGDEVKKGQVLARLDTSTLEQNLIQAQINVKSAQYALEKAKEPTTTASGDRILSAPDPLDIEIKELQLELAKLRLKEAQRQLDEATIIAPFDGLVAVVNISKGDRVSEGATAIRLLDPSKLEVDVLVSEMDVFQLKPGARATVQIDAVSGISFPARVKRISPAATIQQNVVNYKVRLELITGETVATQQRSPSEITLEMLPEQVRKAVQEGRITLEQIRQWVAQRYQQQTAKPAISMADFQPKEGLTVTATIFVNERRDVLLVPNGAIVKEGGKSYVQVVNGETTEKREVVTGLSNWQYTEITEGVSEGEQVLIVKTASSSTSSSTQQTQRPPMMMFR
jgi:HlyD family secretion protein